MNDHLSLIKGAASATGLTAWEKNFIGSMEESHKRWGRLSERQLQVVNKITKKYSRETLAKAESWFEGFSDLHRSRFLTMVDYYRADGTYFYDVVARVAINPEYTPTERLYHSMCENKYARRVIECAESDGLYPVSSLVVVRDTDSLPYDFRKVRGETGVVIERIGGVISAAKSSKRVSILLIGGHSPITIEERWLKKGK